MSTSNKQEIDRITNSTINQAGGDVYVIKGVSAVEVVQICNDIMRAQMSIYTQQANESAQKRLDSFCKKFTTRLTKVEEIISKQLKEPSIQIALYESIKGSIDGNNDELTDELIDLMIDRMSIPERCSKQFIIDAARRVLPKLTQSHIAFLALKVFSDLKLGGNSEVVSEILFSKLEQLLVNCTTISDLDIDYLSQVGCFGNPKMLINKRSIESKLLSIYDLLFRKSCDVADFNNLISTHSYSPQVINLVRSILNFKNDEISFNVTRSEIAEEIIHKQDKDAYEFYQKIKELLIPFTEDETKVYLASNNSNWSIVIDILTKSQQAFLSPLGTYLGTRVLSKHIGIDISLDIFY